MAPLSLVLLATTLAFAPQPARADRAAPLPALQGEAALAHLRREGLDGSLAEALTAARYGARPSPGRPDDFTFNNPAQELRARFDGRGLALESGTAPDRLRLTMRLQSLGYGERQLPVGPGEISAAGQRVESAHSLDGGPAAVVREWFVNRPEGLEHGFTLAEPPGERWAGQPLRLVLSLGGELRAREVKGGQALELVDATGRRVLRYDHLRVNDAEGRELPARLRVAGGELSFEIDDAGARFPVTIDPTFTQQQAYLKASNTEGFQFFGFSVAISGDTLVVGAMLENSSATGVDGDQSDNSAEWAGAAYVFVRSAGAWSQQAYLKASNTDADDRFGESVAISGDTIVVGAFQEDSNATGVDGDSSDNSASSSGAAYVFVRSAGAWSQQAYLKASNTDAFDQFGIVAISGDTLVVGAEGEDSNATGVGGDQSDNSASSSGAAYVFVRSAGSWSQQAYLKASNTGADDLFGRTGVAISGDTLVVGAFGEASNATGVNGDQSDNSAISSGAAYVFVRSAGSWSQQAYLKASNAAAEDQFGESAAISGDTIVVGATREASNATGVDGDQSNDSAGFSGAAYVFVRSAGSWSQQAYLKASNTDSGDLFSQSVAISGDTIVVGAYGESSNATGVDGDQSDDSAGGSGAAYVFGPAADLEMDKAADVSDPDPGDTVVFTLTATNQGPGGAPGVVVTDTLPAGLTYVGNDCGAAFASPTLTWTIGALANLASATCQLTVTVDAGASGTIVNTAAVDGDEFDPQTNNNDDDATLTVKVADLEIQKTVDNAAPTPGETVVFTLTATNQGPSGATGVAVTDTLPAGLTYVSNDCGAAFASPTLTWTIGALANLASATCHLTVTVDAGASGTITNTAAVDGNDFDPEIDNNDDGAMLAVDLLTGYYTVTPCRLVDTRLAAGSLGGPALAANVARDFVLTGACGVPVDAVAVALIVTVVGPTTAGGLQIYPAGSTPLADGGPVSYRAGVTRAGNGLLALGTGGAVSALAKQPAGTVHLILDVAGYFLAE
ncbi:MAG: trimeric autotransporter adhesin [Acidobacteriota bacterium]|nr:trimeric autotransporter adhesin [Acidobacteriota bacterium]